MANDDHLNDYRQFFQYFDETLDPNDQLPVKLASYRLFKKEVVGAIFNWTNQYLSDKECPWHLISFLSRVVIEKTRERCKKQPVQCGFNPSENAYEPLKLMHTVIEVINEVCFNYKSSLSVQNRQNMAVSYPLPAPEDVYNVVSMSALKNNRRKMEDRSVVIHDLNTIFTKQDATPSHYYAVFDGHDGEHAAVYSANHLHQYLAESTNFTTNPEQAIRDAFCKTDSMFIKKCEVENMNGGTTVVCALLLPKEKTLFVAWVGDSQAVLVSEGKVLPCVVPHRPEREDERERIVKDGGMVVHWGVWRVNGQLSVSRAIGDPKYKPYITAIPEIVKIPLGGEEDFIVLASDGLWDYVSKIEVAKVVYDFVNCDPEKANTVSRKLVQLSKQCGSRDNISVIVVFLKDPRQIAAGPRWKNRLVSMDTLDNANNPFAIPNKTNNVDSITSQADDGLLLNFAEELKKNEELPNNDLIKMLEKSNRGLLTPDFDKEDNLGPETNVDNPDDGPTFNNNQNGNPFGDIEKALELNLNLKEGTFEGLTSPDVEECVPPVNSVHNVPQLIDAGADSDSEEEEEWNYVRGEEANKENAAPSQLSSQVAEEEEEDLENAMSQLGPNAAEFVPSPARAVASPLGRLLDEDKVLSRSPKKPPPTEVDINVPDQSDFEEDISQKPHEIEKAFSNGHQDGFDSETNAINALNSRLDEFHFGRNAVPFTPVKLLDQSEASSTRANYGDESAMTLGASFDDSALLGQDQGDFVHKDDPMSMSFHQDRSDDSNIFDLNKVHVLPEDVDEFIAKGGANNSLFDGAISDLTEHYPLGKHAEENPKENEIELAIELGHEDQKIEHLEANKSSTPIEDRSKSPSDIQTPLEEDRAFSPREETKTPSSVGECEIQKAEHHSIPQAEEEECRLKSPNEQIKPKSPFEDEHLISPVEEKVSPSPFEEKELYSTHEEKEVCSPVEEKDVCCLMSKQNEPQNEKEVYEEKDLLSEKEEKLLIEEKQSNKDEESATEKEVTEEKDVQEEEHILLEHQNQVSESLSSPIQDSQITSPQQETKDFLGEANVPSDFGIELTKTEEIVEKIQEETTTVLDREIISPLQDLRVTSPAPSETTTASPVQEKEISSIVQDLDMASPSQEESSLVEKVESPLLEQEVSTAEINEEDFVVVNTSESLGELQFEPFKATNACDNMERQELSPNNEELLNFETEKSDQEKAKEILDNSPEGVNKEESLKPDSLCETKEESANFSVTNQSEISSPQEVGESDLDFHSQSAPEADQVLIDVSNGSYSLNESAADTSSTNTYDINSFLDRSTLEGVEYPITPNLSTDAISNQQNAVQNTEISQSSPIKDQQPDLFKIASSTPVAEKVEVIQPSVTEVKSPVADKTASSKEADKKPATKSKVAPSTTTAKKTPTPRNSLAPTKPTAKPSPKPAAKTIPKSSSATSKVNSTTKTETAAPKLASKSSATAAPRTGTATRAPLTSRPKLPATNGTAKPAPKSTTGTVRKTTEGSTMKSTTSTSLSKTTSSTTARSTVASARSATTTAAPKPRPNTLKPATTRTVDSSKPTTASARTATTAARVPASSRTAATKTSSLLAKETASKTLAKPRSVTDKQVKDTTNKLTAASRTVSKTTSTVQSLAKSTTVTKKTEVTGTKTTTTRTTTASRPPIKRPTDATKTATTKVGKPKQNGVAPVVTEKIIVNNASKELKTNGDQEFVKDNSPVDNKLIADKLTESAAN